MTTNRQRTQNVSATLIFEHMTLNLTSFWPEYRKDLCKFWFISLQWFRSHEFTRFIRPSPADIALYDVVELFTRVA